MGPQFDHERLDVYQRSIEFVAMVGDLTEAVPRKHIHLADQINRASTSVVLNIAEGAGEFSRKDKARFYRFALRSATECAAVIDLLLCLKIVDPNTASRGKELLYRIVSMLTKLVRNLIEGRKRTKRKESESGAGTGTGTGAGTGAGTGTGTGTE